MRFENKVAIITGAAQGIGEAIARRAASDGAKVLIADFNHAGADSVAASINAAGGTALAVRTDVTVPEDVKAAIEAAMDCWGRIDYLVNNASNAGAIGLDDADVVSTEMETWDKVYAANLRGPAAGCKFAIPHMIAGGGGAIVNTASISGMSGDLARTAYGSTKAGLIMLTQYVATSFGKDGIRCNSVSPGQIMSKGQIDNGTDDWINAVFEHAPLDVRGEPSDIANLTTFLLSDEARFITGQNMVSDGGLHNHQPWMADMLRNPISMR